jgi:hypothetical protein
MEEQDSPHLAVRLVALAILYALGLVGIVGALNRLVQ